jgi:hypothetical protein
VRCRHVPDHVVQDRSLHLGSGRSGQRRRIAERTRHEAERAAVRRVRCHPPRAVRRFRHAAGRGERRRQRLRQHAGPRAAAPRWPDRRKIEVGPIGNGWWYNTKGGLSDAELNAWLNPAVLAASDFVAADTYQGTATGVTVSSKIQNMGAWARSTPGVHALGLGEFYMQTPQGMTDATTALAADPLFAFGRVWNMDGTGSANAHVLTGEMLANFKAAFAGW